MFASYPLSTQEGKLSPDRRADMVRRWGQNSRMIQVGDTVLLREKTLAEAGLIDVEHWASSPGLVIDLMEDQSGYLMFEVMFEGGDGIGWWDDYQLRLVEEVESGKDA